MSPSDPSHVKYIAQHSGKCVEIAGASTGNGALLQQGECGGGLNESFGLRMSSRPTRGRPTPTSPRGKTLYGHPGYESFSGRVESPQAVAGQYMNVNFKKYNPSTGLYEYVENDTAHPVLNGNGEYSYSYWGVVFGDWEVVAVYPGSGRRGELG